MNVRWTACDEFLVSVGGQDRCAFIWKHTVEEHAGTSSAAAESDREPGRNEEDFGVISSHTATATAEEDEEDDMFDTMIAPPSGGDESGCVKPWVGNCKAPSNPPQVHTCPPLAYTPHTSIQ